VKFCENDLTMLRSLLFIPATAPQFLAKAAERGAGAIIIDLEDAVLPERKVAARPLAADACRMLAAQGITVLLRVNSDAAWLAYDLAHAPLDCIHAIMLPKVDDAAQVQALAQRLEALEARFKLTQPVRIAALIESPGGVLRADAIATAHQRLTALAFGAEDYCTAMGIAPLPHALVLPVQMITMAAHAAGLECWGLAAGIGTIDDTTAYAATARTARELGFTGAMAIHPRQVAILNEAFSPSAEEITWARRVKVAAMAATARGDGAITLDGRMIDKPIVDRALRLLRDAPAA
jgi:citrate lyase subunit beta / citryl-CoA lyase